MFLVLLCLYEFKIFSSLSKGEPLFSRKAWPTLVHVERIGQVAPRKPIFRPAFHFLSFSVVPLVNSLRSTAMDIAAKGMFGVSCYRNGVTQQFAPCGRSNGEGGTTVPISISFFYAFAVVFNQE